jgi:GntR family transcriptional repressor for pyruvate dehydrogenase complex
LTDGHQTSGLHAETDRLSDDISASILRFIVDEALEEGERLPSERDLAERFETSRLTVSQALRRLSLIGMVDIRRGSGVYVRRDPTAMLGTTFDLMVDLEPGSVVQLADFRYLLERGLFENGTVPKVDAHRLQTGFDALEQSKNRLESWIEADADFHVTLIASTGNRYLHATYEMAHRKILSVSYADWIERGSTPSWLRGQRWNKQLDLHRDILDAALDRDHPQLISALVAHQTELMNHLGRAVDL